MGSYTIQQGDTLTRIARKNQYASWKTLYYHDANASFRQLRPDPNLIYPGDVIQLPPLEPRKMSVISTRQHVFCLKKETEFFKLQLENPLGEALEGKKVLLKVDGSETELTLGRDGIVEYELGDSEPTEASLEVFLEGEDAPSQIFELDLGHLDPVEEVTGVQARLNLLGFDSGEADGIVGPKTEQATKSFQQAYGLEVDGIAGPITKAKLKEVYGS